MRREVDHRFDPVDDEQVVEVIDVAEVAQDQAFGRHGLVVAGRQVVEDRDVVPASEELLDGVAADVSSAARDENPHI
jgi:hypothetical protein